MKSRVNKLATIILLVACIVIPAFVIRALATGTETVTLSGDVTGIQYTAEDAKEYLGKPAYTTVSGTTIKVGDTTKEKHNANPDRIPQPNATNASDYLFAGWYKTYDESTKTFEEPIRKVEDIGDEPVYAKFLTKKVLGVKAQIKAQLRDDEVNAKDVDTGFRFLTSIDGFQYNAIGIEVSYTNGNNETVTSTNENVSKVYSHLYVLDTYNGTLEQNGNPVTARETFGCEKSSFFKAYTITDVPWQAYQYEFTVRPYWITLDGTEVYGDVQVKTVEQGCVRQEVWVAESGAADKDSAIIKSNDVCCYGSQAWPYDTMEYAFKMTNMASKDVVIHVESDITMEKTATLNNSNGINVTVDATKSETATVDVDDSGNNDSNRYQITTVADKQVFQIKQKTGTVTFENMYIAHAGNMVFRMGEPDDTYISNNTLVTKFENIKIDATTEYHYGLIQYNGFQTYNADMINVDIKWVAESELIENDQEIYAAAIRTGAELSEGDRTVNLTMTDCIVDMSEAHHRIGIEFSNSVTDNGNITLNNTSILTEDIYPIDMRAFHLVRTNTTVDSLNYYYKCTPICDRRDGIASINGTPYLSLYDALSAVNYGSEKEVKIVLNYDCALGFDEKMKQHKYVFDKLDNFRLVIDGNGHKLTTYPVEGLDTEQDSSIEIALVNENSSLTLQNLVIEHNTAGRLIQATDSANDFNIALDTVTIKANGGTTDDAYYYGLMNFRNSGTLTMDNVAIDMDTNGVLNKADTDQTGVIRVGNPDDIEKIKISISDCTFDTSNAKDRPAISIQDDFLANIEIAGTNTFNTQNGEPICVYGVATVTGAENTTVNSVAGTIQNLCGGANGGVAGEPSVSISLHDYLYPTLETAMNDANKSTEDTTIHLCKDVTLTGTVTVENENGKNILVDGSTSDGTAKYKITTAADKHAIHVQQKAGQVSFENLDISHDSGYMVFRIGEFENVVGSEDELNLSFKNVYVDASAEYQWSLLQFNGYQTYNANLENVQFVWKTTEETETEAESTERWAVIRNGADSTDYTRTVNLTMTGCTVDATQSNGTIGVALGNKNSDKGMIQLVNTAIKTKNNYPLYISDIEIICDEKTSLESANAYYQGAPIYNNVRGVAQIDGTPYMTLKAALEAAEQSENPVTIQLLYDCVVGFNSNLANDNYEFKTPNRNITIDGKNKVITTVGTETKLNIAASDVSLNMKNVTIKHNATDRLVGAAETLTGCNLTLEKVNLIAEGGTSDTAYQYGLFGWRGSGTIAMTDVAVDMDIDSQSTNSDQYSGVIRTGNAGDNNKVKVEMTGSTIDTTGAANRPAIYITSGTTGDMDIVTSTLSTSTDKPIAVDGNTCLTSDVSVSYGGSGTVSDAGADLNGFSYATLDDALAAANTEGGSATIVLVKEASLAAHTLTKEGLNLIIDGNGKTITTPNTEGTTPSLNLLADNVKLTIKNATITHQNKERLLQVGRPSETTEYTGCAITLNEVTINVTQIATDLEYKAAVIAFRSKAILNMNNSHINMNETATTQTNAGVIRIGNPSEQTEVAVTINMSNGSSIHAENVSNISAIRVNNPNSAVITLDNAQLHTNNMAPIYVDTNAAYTKTELNRSSNTMWTRGGVVSESIYNNGAHITETVISN